MLIASTKLLDLAGLRDSVVKNEGEASHDNLVQWILHDAAGVRVL